MAGQAAQTLADNRTNPLTVREILDAPCIAPLLMKEQWSKKDECNVLAFLGNRAYLDLSDMGPKVAQWKSPDNYPFSLQQIKLTQVLFVARIIRGFIYCCFATSSNELCALQGLLGPGQHHGWR